MGCSFELGDGDTLDLGVVVFVVEAVTLKRERPHLLVIEGADSVDVGSGGQSMELVLGLVDGEHLFDAEVMVTHVVLVLEHLQGTVDLIFVHFKFIINYIFTY